MTTLNDISITILDDGTARIDTDHITGPAHQAAESALLWIARELGGEVSRVKKPGSHIHHHDHDHEHFNSHTHQ